MLDLRSIVVKKLPEDGTLVPKHVGVGTYMKYMLDLRSFVVNKLRSDGTWLPKHVRVGTYKCVLLRVLLYCNWCILFVENMECKKMHGMSKIKNKKSPEYSPHMPQENEDLHISAVRRL